MPFDDKYQEELKKEKVLDRIEETYNKSVEAGNRITEEALSWAQKYLLNIVLTVLSLFMVGIQQFAEPQFDPYFFLRANFWYEYLPFVTAQWLILLSTISGNNKWLSEVDKTYLDLSDRIQNHANKNKETPYIHEGAKMESRERKVKAFKVKKGRELNKLIKSSGLSTFGATKDFLAGNDKLKPYILFPKTRRKLLRRKFNTIIEMLTDTYINSNIDEIKVKYVQVTESGLLNGFKSRGKDDYEPDFQEHTFNVVIGEFGLGQLVMMVIGFIILSLDLVSKGADVSTWAMFLLKLFILFWVYTKATFRSKPIFKKTQVKALQERASMLDRIERRVLNK
jgi:hypothetical protein